MSGLVWIDEPLALAVHEQLLVRHGGPSGVRDLALLQSALARPQQLQAYGDAVDLIALAAAYAAGVSHNHPFIDGNKRSAFLLGALFLELNEARFTASEDATIEAVLALAAGELDEDAYRGFLRKNVDLA